MVDVRFCGDPTGQPVLYLPTMATAEFISEMEKELYFAGIYVITIFPPAQGRTDPATQGDPRHKIWVDDIEAVMDMLNVESFPLFICNAGTPQAFKLAEMLPNRISRVVLTSACPPASHWLRYGTSASWVDAALQIGEKYPAVKRLVATAALKGCVAIGAKRFHKLQLAAYKKDVDVQMLPENVQQIENALEAATTFGLEAMIDDCVELLFDYSERIANSHCPISIIHGANDPVFPIQCMRDFQKELHDRIELYEVDDAGFTLVSSHPKQVVNLFHGILNADQTKDYCVTHAS